MEKISRPAMPPLDVRLMSHAWSRSALTRADNTQRGWHHARSGRFWRRVANVAVGSPLYTDPPPSPLRWDYAITARTLGRSVTAPSPAGRRAEGVGGSAQTLVLGDPALRGGLGRETCGKLWKCTDPDDFDGKAVVVTMNDSIGDVCHPQIMA